MGIVVDMFLNLEDLVVLLEPHAYLDVKGLVVLTLFRIVGVLDEFTLPGGVCLYIHTLFDKFRVEVIEHEETSSEVYHRAYIAVAVDEGQRGNACLTGHTEVISAEGPGDMHDTCTILGRHIVAGNYAESTLAGVHPGDKLLIGEPYQLFPLEGCHHLERYQLRPLLILVELEVGGFWIEHRVHQGHGHDHGLFLPTVRIVGADNVIFDFRAYGQRGVGRKCPGGGGPGQEVGLAPALHHLDGVGAEELGHAGGVLHIAVTSGLVELMGAETGTGGGRVGLDCVAFVEIPLVVKLLEQPPARLDVAVVVCHIRIVKVNPVAHGVGKGGPFLGVFHHFVATCGVVVIHRDFFADVLLGDAERLFNAKLHGESVGVPAGLAVNAESLHRLVTAENILNSAGHHMVDAGHTVGRGGTLEEDERSGTLAQLDTAAEQVIGVPLGEHLLVDTGKVEIVVFGKLHLYDWF